jgi:hypothetical protein
MLSGGYYGLTTVFNKGFKGTPDTAMFGETDHWAMIVGWRYARVEDENDDPKERHGHWRQEIMIANSAKSSPLEEWLCVGDFLKAWGGFGVFFAKPK